MQPDQPRALHKAAPAKETALRTIALTALAAFLLIMPVNSYAADDDVLVIDGSTKRTKAAPKADENTRVINIKGSKKKTSTDTGAIEGDICPQMGLRFYCANIGYDAFEGQRYMGVVRGVVWRGVGQVIGRAVGEDGVTENVPAAREGFFYVIESWEGGIYLMEAHRIEAVKH